MMESSREVIGQVKDDSSSLYVHCETDSILSRRTGSTENSPKLSMAFPFDKELLGSKAYQGAFRSFLKRRVRRRKLGDSESTKSLLTIMSAPSYLSSNVYQRIVQSVSELTLRKDGTEDDVSIRSLMSTRGISFSEAKEQIRIDKQLEEDGKMMEKECKVLMLGGPGKDRDIILKQMKITRDHGYRQDELLTYREQVIRVVIDVMRTCMEQLKSSSVQLGNNTDYETDFILQQSSQTNSISPRLAMAMHSLWESLEFRGWYSDSFIKHAGSRSMDSAP
jgi:hypothetical protein